jgi:hypothetical protein
MSGTSRHFIEPGRKESARALNFDDARNPKIRARHKRLERSP